MSRIRTARFGVSGPRRPLRYRPSVVALEDRDAPGSAIDLLAPTNVGILGMSLFDVASHPAPVRSFESDLGQRLPSATSVSAQAPNAAPVLSSATSDFIVPSFAQPVGDVNLLQGLRVPPPSGRLSPGGTDTDSPINGPFDSFALPACDDCSSDTAVPLGFTFNFFGVQRSSIWINNNGNLTFNSAFGDFAPQPLSTLTQPTLAPYWSDVYTIPPTGSGVVTYGQGSLDSDPAFGVTWQNVTRFLQPTPVNYYQVVIIDHSARLGYQEVQFNYLSIQWDHADSDGGVSAPRVGYNNGAGQVAEFGGSGTFGTMIDGGSQSLQVARRITLIVYPS